MTITNEEEKVKYVWYDYLHPIAGLRCINGGFSEVLERETVKQINEIQYKGIIGITVTAKSFVVNMKDEIL
jgi:hypothetical protein